MPKESLNSFPLTDDDLKEISKSLSTPLLHASDVKPSVIAALTVPEMKAFVKYINMYKVEPTRALKMSGKKAELRQRLEKYLWPDQRHGIILPTRDDRLFSVKSIPHGVQGVGVTNGFGTTQLGRNPIVSTGNGSLSGVNLGGGISSSLPSSLNNSKRVPSYTENINRDKIEKDFTLEGRQDPYYVIDKLLDIAFITNQKSKLELNIVLNPGEMEKVSGKLYDIHLYWLTASLHPQNWQDATISWNDTKLSLPRSNRKLRKKLKKKTLITSTPLIIPENIIRHQNKLTILHPNFTQVEGNLLVTFIRNNTTEDLILKVKDRTEKWKTLQSKKDAAQESTIATPIGTSTEPDLIMSEDEIITLNDALSLERIEIACRGKGCSHKTCFDITSYLEYSHFSNVWNCPVCDKPLRYEELIIDSNIDRIISEVSSEIDKVKLHADGTYTILIPEGVMQIPHNEEIKKQSSYDSERTESLDQMEQQDQYLQIQGIQESHQNAQVNELQNVQNESFSDLPINGNQDHDVDMTDDRVTELGDSSPTNINSESDLNRLLEAISDDDIASIPLAIDAPIEIAISDSNSPSVITKKVSNQKNEINSARMPVFKQTIKPNNKLSRSIKRFFQPTNTKRDPSILGNSELNPIEID